MSWQLPDLEGAAFFHRLRDAGTPWLAALHGCPQNPVYHAEGDVLIHTGLVCRELVELAKFRAAPAQDQQILAWAALLHDIAKPDCNMVDSDGVIHSPGHALRGSQRARRILWEMDCPFAAREQIVGLVAHHMTPPWIFERPDPTRLVHRISLDCRPELLATLVEADARGRVCPDQERLLETLALFRELIVEAGVGEGPLPFASPSARYLYFQDRWHTPDQPPFDDFRCHVVVLSGLPGSGKDTWIARNYADWPVVSLDALRASMGVSARAPQGAVIEAGRALAREHLRAGRDFVWNATNITRQVRDKCLSLFHEYGARVTVIYLECPRRRLLGQNRRRDAAVPDAVLERLLRRWEIPHVTEAHEVEYHIMEA